MSNTDSSAAAVLGRLNDVVSRPDTGFGMRSEKPSAPPSTDSGAVIVSGLLLASSFCLTMPFSSVSYTAFISTCMGDPPLGTIHRKEPVLGMPSRILVHDTPSVDDSSDSGVMPARTSHVTSVTDPATSLSPFEGEVICGALALMTSLLSMQSLPISPVSTMLLSP